MGVVGPKRQGVTVDDEQGGSVRTQNTYRQCSFLIKPRPRPEL